MKKSNVNPRWVLAALCGLYVFTLAACVKKQTVKEGARNQAFDEEAVPGPTAEPVQTEELDIHGKDFERSGSLAAVHFEFDSKDLSVAAREALLANADYIKKNPDFEILVEGHCDSRGTIGYNLALGQRRAQVVREYYISLGIEPRRIGTVSYGEEKGMCLQENEACWFQNRRAETKLHTYNLSGR